MLVYIPQHGPGTASLNVAVAASIVLHHFATWAAYPERSRTHAKFDVGERPLRTARRGVPNAGMADLLRVVVTCHISCRKRNMCIHSLSILTDTAPLLCAAGAQAESRQHSIRAKSSTTHIKEKYLQILWTCHAPVAHSNCHVGKGALPLHAQVEVPPSTLSCSCVSYFWGQAYSCTAQQMNPAACKGCHRHAQARCRRPMKNGMRSASAEGWQRQSRMIRIRCPWVRALACFKGEVALPYCGQQAFPTTAVMHPQCGHIASSSEKRASQSLVQVRVSKAVWVAALGVCMVGGTASVTVLRVLGCQQAL